MGSVLVGKAQAQVGWDNFFGFLLPMLRGEVYRPKNDLHFYSPVFKNQLFLWSFLHFNLIHFNVQYDGFFQM